MLTNFHTHHYYCRHAKGNVEDYVKQAIKEKYSIIGISDHAPLEKYYDKRMTLSEFPKYLSEIKQCQKKYQDIIEIKSALECEYFSDMIEFYELLKTKLDYIILAIHDYVYNGKMYCSYYINNKEMLKGYFETMMLGIKSKYFSFVAHPDLFAFSYHLDDLAKVYTHKLAKLCIEKDMILEFNANGYRRGKDNIRGEYRFYYPYKPFWEIIKEYNVKVIVNSDCHNPLYLNDKYERYARSQAISWGLNVVNKL